MRKCEEYQRGCGGGSFEDRTRDCYEGRSGSLLPLQGKTDWDRNVPVSNLQTKAVPDRREYPMNLFLGEGLLVTVNTDNRTVSGTTVTDELKLFRKIME